MKNGSIKQNFNQTVYGYPVWALVDAYTHSFTDYETFSRPGWHGWLQITLFESTSGMCIVVCVVVDADKFQLSAGVQTAPVVMTQAGSTQYNWNDCNRKYQRTHLLVCGAAELAAKLEQ